MALESFKAILHSRFLLIQYTILAGLHGLHGRMLHPGNLCNLCPLSDSHWLGQVSLRLWAGLAETATLYKGVEQRPASPGLLNT